MGNIDDVKAPEIAPVDGENDSKEQEPAMPELPDGIGLGYEDIQKMLAMKHNTSLSADDPILMMVSVCNVFLEELQKLHEKHNDAVKNIMADQSSKYITGVKNTTDALAKTLADTSVDAIKNIFDSHAAALKANNKNSRWCAAIIGISALVNVAIMALAVWM